MSTTHLALAISAAVAIAGCSIGKPIPQATTYVVEPPMPALSPASERRAQSMRMGNVRVAAAFSGNALVYRTGDVQFVSDPYQAFIAEPAAMLGNRMAEWLDRAGPFKTVSQPGNARPAAFVLEATATELYGDFRAGQAPAAVMAVQFALIDPTTPRPTVVLERTIASRIVIAEATPDALVRGYGTALAEILTQLASELQQVSRN